MNRLLHLTLCFILLLTCVSLAQVPLPNGSGLPPLITVSGSAEVKVAPDQIDLRVGVETRNPDVAIAKRENDQRLTKVLAFLKESKVEDKNVQTDFVSVEVENPNRNPPIYVVRKSVEINLTKIEGFEAILTGLLTNGVTHVHGVEFRTSELRKHRDAARALAIRAAKEKADALAAELGVKRGKVYSINANEWGGWWSSSSGYWGQGYGSAMAQNSVQNSGAAAEPADGTLSIGQISVSASVSVAFLIDE